MMDYIKGNFRKYIFRSEDGYVVGLIKVKDASESLKEEIGSTITFTGYFQDLNESDLYELEGEFTEHYKYGPQFNASSYKLLLPDEKESIISFLSSDLFPKIGQAKAKKIVDVLGTNALEVILSKKENLLLVPTITKKQMDMIYEKLYSYQSNFNTLLMLTKLGFSTKDALKVQQFYKEKTEKVLNENPYQLLLDLKEMTFFKIDKMRSSLNIKEDDPNRIKAALIHFAKQIAFQYGNTCFTKEELYYVVYKNLFIKEEVFSLIFDELLEDESIIKTLNGYMIDEYYEEEYYVSERIKSLLKKECDINVTLEDIKTLEEYFNITYNDDQKKAILDSMKYPVSIITGGPGTGKTTIIKAICKLYQDKNKWDNKTLEENLCLLAPTGRASRKMSEHTLLKASTIHRFLKWNKEDNSFRVNEDNPSNVSCVILDEVSMVDITLLYNLFLGLKNNIKIIFIGDENQLPSVGPGQVLKDLIETKKVPYVKLEKLYRQKTTSNIAILAHDITNNNINKELFNKDEGLQFIPSDASNICEVLQPFLEEEEALKNEFQVLAPVYKAKGGIDELNNYIQNILNQPKKTKNEITIDGVVFREKDKVLQLVNEPDENIFNGDIGEIVQIKSLKDKEIVVDYLDNRIRYEKKDFQNIRLGYAISIHKSQGSEFDTVLLPVLSTYKNMLYKKLLYTAITRAKTKLIIFGQWQVFEKALLNNKDMVRKTNLKKFFLDV